MLFCITINCFYYTPNAVTLREFDEKNLAEAYKPLNSNETAKETMWPQDIKNGLYLVPSGQSIGIKLKSDGLMVVGYHLVQTQDGEVSPADKTIRLGDNILTINDEEIKEINDVDRITNKFGPENKPLKITYMRDDKKFECSITPAYNITTKSYQLGIYVRNIASGIGTLTFYEPTHGVYGALGHAIADVDTNKLVTVGEGRIFQSKITSIEKGESGDPGEKKGFFIQEGKLVGDIWKNTSAGIFGQMHNLPKPMASNNRALPVGLAAEITEGDAQIMTVVAGDRVELFDIKIEEISLTKAKTKGLVIKVTDPRLLSKTGGIVQGMSGSPIIQNNKLIGAVTHVLVNDPTSGYGIFIESMLKEAGLPTGSK